MKHAAILTAAACALLAAAAPHAGAAEATEVRRFEQTFLPGPSGKVHVSLFWGPIEIRGTDGKTIEAEMQLFCTGDDLEACRQRAARLRLVARSTPKELRIKLKGTSRGRARGIKSRLVVKVPRRLALEVDAQKGNISIRGMRSDLNVDAAGGDVDVLYPKKLVREVFLRVGVGQANLWLDDGRVKASGFPRTVRWQHDGRHRISVVVGTGDVDVRLE